MGPNKCTSARASDMVRLRVSSNRLLARTCALWPSAKGAVVNTSAAEDAPESAAIGVSTVSVGGAGDEGKLRAATGLAAPSSAHAAPAKSAVRDAAHAALAACRPRKRNRMVNASTPTACSYHDGSRT